MNTNPKEIKTSARVFLTIEIDLGEKWGPECQIDQVHKQASESAIGIIRSMKERLHERRIKIIGEPKVTAVLVEET